MADELGRYVRAQVQIVEDVLQKAPSDTYLLFAGGGDLSRSFADCGPALAARLAPRIVLLDVSWQKALEQLEKHRLAGAVDSLRLSEWLARPSSCTGPFGLRYLTKPLGASCVPLPSLCSAHYCLLQGSYHGGMPQLLANYLAAYDRDQQPLSAVRSVSLARVPRLLTEWAGGNAQRRAGSQLRATPFSQVESVSIKRVVDSLKRARESAQMSLPQLAARSGLDSEQLGLLEGSDYARATLGTLRAYLLALEPTCGWTIVEAGEPVFPPIPWTQDQGATAKINVSSSIAFGIEAGVEPADLSGPSALSAVTPWMLVERGMTVLVNRRSRRREPEGELDNPTVRTKEESYAGV